MNSLSGNSRRIPSPTTLSPPPTSRPRRSASEFRVLSAIGDESTILRLPAAFLVVVGIFLRVVSMPILSTLGVYGGSICPIPMLFLIERAFVVDPGASCPNLKVLLREDIGELGPPNIPFLGVLLINEALSLALGDVPS